MWKISAVFIISTQLLPFSEDRTKSIQNQNNCYSNYKTHFQNVITLEKNLINYKHEIPIVWILNSQITTKPLTILIGHSQKILGALHNSPSNLILIKIIQGKCCYYSDFTDDKAVAQST